MNKRKNPNNEIPMQMNECPHCTFVLRNDLYDDHVKRCKALLNTPSLYEKEIKGTEVW